MDNKITMDRRKFLERFAKLSTATIMVGICVACPGPSEDYNNESSLSVILTINTVKVIDIDARTQNILSVVSINLSTIYIEFNNSSILLDNPNFIKITDEYTETLISFTQEKIDDTTLKLTLDDNQLNYGSQYSIIGSSLPKTLNEWNAITNNKNITKIGPKEEKPKLRQPDSVFEIDALSFYNF